MKGVLKLLLILASSLPLLAQDGEGWVKMRGASCRWEDSLPVDNPDRAALVLDSPARTRLRAAFLPTPFPATPVRVSERVGELLGIFQKEKEAILTIDWLGTVPADADFARAIHLGTGMIRSTFRTGTISVARTVICSREQDAIFIHLIADQPGALSFRVTLETGPDGKVEIADRRQLVLTPATGLASHLWVLPFESDVTSEGQSIMVRGEGEALIVWNYAHSDKTAGQLSLTLTQLGDRYDAGHSPPDPSKIWQGLINSHLKSQKNSP